MRMKLDSPKELTDMSRDQCVRSVLYIWVCYIDRASKSTGGTQGITIGNAHMMVIYSFCHCSSIRVC